MTSRKPLFYLSILILAAWVTVLWITNWPPPPAESAGSGLAYWISQMLWRMRFAWVGLLILAFYPQLIARPFRLASGFPSRDARRRSLHNLYYWILVGGLAVAMLWAWSPPTLPDLGALFASWQAAVAPYRSMVPPAGLEWTWETAAALVAALVLAAVNTRFCWRYGYLLQKRDRITWIGFFVLATTQSLLLAWVPTSSWLGIGFAMVLLPTNPLLLTQLRGKDKRSDLPALILLLLLLVLGIAIGLLIGWPGAWLAMVAAMSLLLAAFTFFLALAYTTRQGYTAHLIERLRVHRHPIRVAFQPSREAVPGLLRPLVPVARVLVRIAIQITNVLQRVFVLLANTALFATLKFFEILIRVPETVGASMVRAIRSIDFYLQYIFVPALGYASAGIAVAYIARTISAYYMATNVNLGFGMIIAFVTAVMGLILAMSSLFEVTPSYVSDQYLKWNLTDTERTPVSYFVYFILLMWFIQTIGFLVGLLIWEPAESAFRPGLFYALESVILVVGIIMLLPGLFKRR